MCRSAAHASAATGVQRGRKNCGATCSYNSPLQERVASPLLGPPGGGVDCPNLTCNGIQTQVRPQGLKMAGKTTWVASLTRSYRPWTPPTAGGRRNSGFRRPLTRRATCVTRRTSGPPLTNQRKDPSRGTDETPGAGETHGEADVCCGQQLVAQRPVPTFQQRRAGRHALCLLPEQRRLAVEWDGKVELYDTGTHQISGVLQSSTQAAGHARFTDQTGEVDMASLKRVER